MVRDEVPAAVFEHSEAVVPVGRAADGPSPDLHLQKSNLKFFISYAYGLVLECFLRAFFVLY